MDEGDIKVEMSVFELQRAVNDLLRYGETVEDIYDLVDETVDEYVHGQENNLRRNS